jgi:sugar phosphate isomerase/epimerase
MHRRVSVSAMCTPTWDLDRDLAFYADAEIDQVGIALRKLEASGLEKGTARIARAGLRVTNLLGLGFDLVDRQRWSGHQERLARALEAAHELRAECFVLTTGSAGPMAWEDAASVLAEAIGPVVDRARALGVPFALEHTNSLRVDVGFVHTLRDIIDLARMLDVGVVMECNACWAERALQDTIREGVDRLRLVQVSDYVIGTLQTPDRAVPGDGDIPLLRMLRQLLDAGYEGVFDIELMGPRIEAEGYQKAVPRAVGVLGRWLDDLGVPA